MMYNTMYGSGGGVNMPQNNQVLHSTGKMSGVQGGNQNLGGAGSQRPVPNRAVNANNPIHIKIED